MSRRDMQDFPGDPLVKTVLPMQGVWIWSLTGKLRSHMLCSVAKKLKKYIFKGTCRRIWGGWSFHNDLGGYCYTSVHYYQYFEHWCCMFICVIFDNKKGFKNLACFLESWGALSPFALVGIICILFQLVWRFLCLQNTSSVRVEVSKERPELWLACLRLS